MLSWKFSMLTLDARRMLAELGQSERGGNGCDGRVVYPRGEALADEGATAARGHRGVQAARMAEAAVDAIVNAVGVAHAFGDGLGASARWRQQGLPQP
jgi:hypothetical protein